MTTTPKYKNPPVVETIIGVQFPGLLRFRAAHFGLYWQTIRERFDACEDKPRLPEIVEVFPRNPLHDVPRLRVATGSRPDRVWYVAKDEGEIIQVQPDRFLFNWRRRTTSSTGYSSYEDNSKKFHKEFAGFCRFCEKTPALEKPAPSLCEVTYINHIDPGDGESAIDLFGKVFAGLTWNLADDRLPEPEGAAFNRVFVIQHSEIPVGRLYIEASIAVRREEKQDHEFVLLRVTGRVKHPLKQGGELSDSLQLAHDWVVNGFASTTNTEIQREHWERI